MMKALTMMMMTIKMKNCNNKNNNNNMSDYYKDNDTIANDYDEKLQQ